MTAARPGGAPDSLGETVSVPQSGQPPRDLAARLFRALYPQVELRTFGDLHVAVPKGTPWFAGHSMAEIARQISGVPPLGPAGDLGGQAGTR